MSPLSDALLGDLTESPKGRPKKHHNLLKALGSKQVSYLAINATTQRLVLQPGSTYPAVISAVAGVLDLEYRLCETSGDFFNKHRRGGLKYWHKVRILQEGSKGAPKDELLALGLVCVSLLVGLFPDVYLVGTSWCGQKMTKRLSLCDAVVSALLAADTPPPVVQKAGPPGSYTMVETKEGRAGGYHLVTGGDMGWAGKCTTWSLAPGTLVTMGHNLKNGHGPFAQCPDVDCPEGLTKQDAMRWYREQDRLRPQWYALRLAHRELRGLEGGAQWPPSFDFRGRLYLQGYSSPQNMKALRPHILGDDGRHLTYYDMRTSNVTLIRLLMGLPLGEDLYSLLATKALPQWSGLLADVYGEPTRDLMKEWLKGVFFGQRLRSSVDRLTRYAVRSAKQDQYLHGEVLRILGYLWSEADSVVPSAPFSVPQCGDPRLPLVCPDGWEVPLGYRRPKARRVKTKLRGTIPSMQYHEYTEGSLDMSRVHRALTANVIHSLESFILREQLRGTPQRVLPIHDCLGLHEGTDKERLAGILRNSLDTFRSSLVEQGLLDSDPGPTPGYTFEDLYKQEDQ